MVEAPGTAPGSALLILQHVYRHSWRTSTLNIEAMAPVLKDSFALNCLSALITALFACFGHRIAPIYDWQIVRLSACTVIHGHAILTKQQVGALAALYAVTVTLCVTCGDKLSIK